MQARRPDVQGAAFARPGRPPRRPSIVDPDGCASRADVGAGLVPARSPAAAQIDRRFTWLRLSGGDKPLPYIFIDKSGGCWKAAAGSARISLVAKHTTERAERLTYANRQLAALNQVSNSLTQIHDEERLLEAVPELLTSSLDFDRAVLMLEQEGQLVLRSLCFPKDTPELTGNFLKRLDDPDYVVPPHFRKSLENCETIFIADLNADPNWPKQPGEVIRTKALLITPIKAGGQAVGVVVGNLQHHQREMDAQDVARFEMFANMVGLALDNIRAYQSLERTVIERTRSLEQANRELREKAAALESTTQSLENANRQLESSAQQLRAIIEASPIPLIITRVGDGRILYANELLGQLLGTTPRQLIGRNAVDLYCDAAERAQIMARLGAENKLHNQEVRLRRADGAEIWVIYSAVTTSLEGHPVVIGGLHDIHDRKRAEEALQRSELRFRSVAQSANDAIISADQETRIAFWNNGARRIFGYEAEEILGQPLTNLLPEPLRPAQSRLLQRLAVAKRSRRLRQAIQVEGRRKSGAAFPMELSLATWHSAEGTFFTAIIRDITRRKSAEAALEKRLRYEEGLAACSQALLTQTERHQALAEAIQHLLKASDVSRVYIFQNFEDPQDGLCMRQTHEACAPGVKPVIDNPQLQRLPYRDGFERWRELLSNGNAIGGLVATFPPEERAILEPQGIRSILAFPLTVASRWYGFIGFDQLEAQKWSAADAWSLRTAAEMIGVYIERSRVQKALRQSEERFRGLVENAHDIIYSLTPEGIFSYVSPNIQDLLGHPAAEVLGRSFIPLVHPDDVQPCLEFLRRVIETGQAGSIEYRVLHKNGEYKWHASNGSVLRDESGKVISFIGVARDITQIKEVMADLAQVNQHLRATQSQLVQSEKMAALGMLVAGVAHEINTPIGAIHSTHDTMVRAFERLTDQLRARLPDAYERDQELHNTLRVMQDSCRILETGSNRVATIVRRLRSFARLDEAEIKLADIHDGLEDTLALIRHQLKDRIEVVKRFSAIEPIACYPGRLNQVFLNILMNAVQALPGPGRITVTTFQRDNQIHIAIQDNGCGIAPQHLEKIFDPGFTTKGVGVGTGLGLSICYQIMQDHHGEIRVESELGKGTTFTLILPTDLEKRLEGISL